MTFEDLMNRAEIGLDLTWISVRCTAAEYDEDLASNLLDLEFRYGDEWCGAWQDGVAVYTRC